MDKYTREKIILDLGHEIYNFLEADYENDLRLTGLIHEAGGHTWGFSSFDEIECWSNEENENEINFITDISFTGQDTRANYSSITAKIKGRIEYRGGAWRFAGCEILHIEPDIEFDYDNYFNPTVVVNEHYFETFSKEIARLKELNKVELDSPETQTTLQRLVFSGSITCLETFLMDALVKWILANSDGLKSFFNNYTFDEGCEKIFLREVANNDDILEKKAKLELSKLLYHNLSKVSRTYKSVMQITIPPFGEIARDVSTRHDLVHRNGKTVEGESVKIDKQIVDDVIQRVETFITQIHRDIEALIPF